MERVRRIFRRPEQALGGAVLGAGAVGFVYALFEYSRLLDVTKGQIYAPDPQTLIFLGIGAIAGAIAATR